MEKEGGKGLNNEEVKEKQLVKRLRDLFERDKPYFLRKVYGSTKLSTKKFQEVWSDWWGTEIPPKLEVDLVFVFEKESGDVSIVAAEVEYFRNKRKNFTDGLQQALSFGLFGFDSLVLWHIFAEKMETPDVESYVKPMNELVEGLELPVVYVATRLAGEDRFEFFAPPAYYSSSTWDHQMLLKWLEEECGKRRNLLLNRENVERARRTLKVVLRIPV